MPGTGIFAERILWTGRLKIIYNVENMFINNMAKLRLEVQGELGAITLRGFLDSVENALGMLSDFDVAISRHPKGSLDWVVTDIAVGSLVVAIESKSRAIEENFGPAVVHSFISGWEQIEKMGTTPPYLSEQGMNRAKKITRLIGRQGLTGFVVHGDAKEVQITAKASAHMEQLLKVRLRSIGSVEGRLETISIHKGARFIIYHSRTHKAVTCKVPAEQLKSMITTEMLGRRVGAFGMVYSNEKGEPLRVDAERIRVLRAKEDLPSIASLGGSDPHFTGDMTTEEYIRSLREILTIQEPLP